MFFSRRCASDNFSVPVEPTTLLYKEMPEFIRRLWRQQPAGAPEFFRLGPGAAAGNLPAAECGVSW
jgi:hypothetical protein